METKKLIERLLKYYSYADIASKLGKSESAICRWKNESRKPHKLFVREMRNLLAEKE